MLTYIQRLVDIKGNNLNVLQFAPLGACNRNEV